MIGLVIGLFERTLLTFCLMSLVLLALSLAALVRFLPGLVAFLGRLLRGFLIFSFRLYYFVLGLLDPLIRLRLGISVLSGFGRVGGTLLLSLALGLLLLAVARVPLSGWSVGLLMLHGLFVGLVWDEVEELRGLDLGAKIPWDR